MKTAISLPDRIFLEAERYARRTGRSRSQLIAVALTEYLARHAANGNGKSTLRGRSGLAAKGRVRKSELRRIARAHPVPQSWFDEPAVDLTKPSDT
jgi:metal-responsive CopG/Arc/MetJ family transcriptional regulator